MRAIAIPMTTQDFWLELFQNYVELFLQAKNCLCYNKLISCNIPDSHALTFEFFIPEQN